MKMTFFACMVVALAAMCAAAMPDDAGTLKGTWKPIKALLAGTPLPPAVLHEITLKMADGSYEVTVEGEQPDKGTWTIDTKSKPNRMTITSTDGANKGKTFPSIYEIKANTLRVCYDLSGVKHPTEFKSAKGTKLYLVTYERKMP